MITNANGDGPIKTYIHKVNMLTRRFLLSRFSVMALILIAYTLQVYPWTDIRDAHLDMEANKNRCAAILHI